jgi:hypothetical protein
MRCQFVNIPEMAPCPVKAPSSGQDKDNSDSWTVEHLEEPRSIV